jgi:transcription-repair coupling factor (superfamily II helicase)
MYKRVAGVERESQLDDVRSELIDRYGGPPAAVRNLLDYAELKLLAVRVGVNSIDRKRDLVSVKFRPTATVDPERLARFVASRSGARFTPDGTLQFTHPATAAPEVIAHLKQLLGELARAESSTVA